MACREILTFQIGNYANYTGAHWWNIQESYFQYDEKHQSDIYHDVLFREGKTLLGHVTFTPRLILLDKPDKVINAPILNDPPIKSPSVDAVDDTKIEIQEQPIPEKHEFIQDLECLEKGQKVDMSKKNYNFDETVRNWSDYLKTRFHPKSVCTFQNSYQSDVFYFGEDIYKSIQDDFTERIRSYMEECDNLQGFQVLVDATDAFGGLANSALLHLQDEYSSKTVLTIPLIRGNSNSTEVDDIKRTVNILLTYQKLTENSSLLVPLGTNKTAWRNLGPPTIFPNLIYNNDNSYQTSAILASFLDTVTLKYRLRKDHNQLHDLISGLNYYNKKMCAASISLPFPISSNAYLLETLENLDESVPLWSQLTPGCNLNNDTIFYQRITVRGIPLSRLRNPKIIRKDSHAHSCSNVEELVHLYLSYRQSTISNVTSTELPLKTVMPFPKIFSSQVSLTGAVDENSKRKDNFEVQSCPVITGLHCCKGVGQMLDSLHGCVKALNVKRYHHFFGPRMDVDEFNETLEKLLAMGCDFNNYNDMR